MARARRRWPAIAALYGGGLVIGLTIVSFPSSSAYLKSVRGFTDAQYGAIYLPQLVAAIVGAVGGAVASRAWPLRRLFAIALVCFLAAQVLLLMAGRPTSSINAGFALTMIMAATASFGFGFGFGGGPLNGLVAQVFADRRNTAITALHMCAGAGMTIGPFIFSEFTAANRWSWSLVLLALITTMVLLCTPFVAVGTAVGGDVPEHAESAASSSKSAPLRLSPARDKIFWITAFAAVAYALAEGTFSNWAILYVQDDVKLSAMAAAGSLTAFWALLTVGRLAGSILAIRYRPVQFLRVMPLSMIVALLLIRQIDSTLTALLAFGFAGLACSAFFPMLVGFAAEGRPNDVSWIASMLTAALMVGVGIGSYVVGSLRDAIGIRDLYLYAIAYPAIAWVAISFAALIGRSSSSLRR